MEIVFCSKKLEKTLTDDSQLKREYGQLAKKIRQRLLELRAAENLEVMRTISAANCHTLTGDLAGFLAVDVSCNWRMLLTPNHEPTPELPDGGLDWNRVVSICVEAIEDYH
jgi:proteic killer suppression protein